MSILDRIVADKKIEVAQKKKLFPVSYYEASPLFDRPRNSLSLFLRQSKSGIIAEHKRRSPSKQNINSSLSVSEVAIGYEAAGVCGMSVLTDGKYFGGSLEDLNIVRASTKFPILRKEFIVDEYIDQDIIKWLITISDVFTYVIIDNSYRLVKSIRTVKKDIIFDDICCICHEQPDCKTSCNHEMCLQCVNVMETKTCPICRSSFDFCYIKN